MVGVAGDAGDRRCVAALHRARGAAQRDHAAGAAHRNVVEPAQRHAEMLRQADRAVRRERKARDAQPVDPVLAEAGLLEESGERAGKEPVRAANGITHIRHGDGRGHHHIVVACAPVIHDRFGTTAVASISTLASSSTSATTCTSVITGKCAPITLR